MRHERTPPERTPAGPARTDGAGTGLAIEPGRRTDAPALVGVLDDLLRAHKSLESLVARQREAVERADARALEPVRAEIVEHLEQIRVLEHKRRAVVQSLTGRADTRLEHAAAAMDDPHREAAMDIGARLKDVIARVRHEQEVVREAATHLMTHMQGLARCMHQGLSHAGVYGRAGRVEAGAAVVTGVDMTS